MLLVILGVLTILFVILRLSGDPVALLAPPGSSPSELARLRQVYGLADPTWVQYVRYLGGIARLDFGRSLIAEDPVLTVVLRRVPATAELAAAAFVIAVPIGIGAGTTAALLRGRPASYAISALAVLGQSIPTFWLGILLIVVFAVGLRWLPSFGAGGLAHLVLPAITLSAFLAAKLARLVRAEVLDVLGQEFVLVGAAKGLSRWRVTFHHALRNALLPVASLLGLELSHLLGGAVVTETVFAWPGIGQQLVESVLQRDYPVVQGAVIVITMAVVLMGLATDLLYATLDPRIRIG